ncbi:META domain protein [Falsiruegeria litorea R37]|uniref:META domain protein n=1 Tax=Falsiruegeria litorea R37 TaxID=1200284 RepID=A0A1Y5RT37_9RHOB|nr:META domain-containing protein [Falsiruegeria litorea]SLN22080.1 META domain protein [Falsiruegeria litorea R37]
MRTLLILPFLALLQCSSDETIAAYGAAGLSWELQSIDADRFSVPVTLTFPETGRIAGQAPCNAYRAALDAPYPWFELKAFGADTAECPHLVEEGTYFAALLSMTQSEVSGNTLILRNDAGNEMVFTAAE